MEGRKEFINRMMWMVREVESSKFNTLESLPMLEFELRKRDVRLMKELKDLIINFIDTYPAKPHNKNLIQKISTKTECRFDELINRIE
tara:strand:+ start:333 stop:596 length:264 start_codon:yes stop_codon:yes gene_type:complete